MDIAPTSAIGRAITDQVRPKYKALGKDDGLVKTLFKGGAIVKPRHTGHPLVIAEGPTDAAAGIPLVVALEGANQSGSPQCRCQRLSRGSGTD